MVNNEIGINKFFTKVYAWMFIGLLVSGAVAYYTSITSTMLKFVMDYYLFIIIVELVVVVAFSALRNKVSPIGAKLLFIIYSALSGLTLSSIFLVYKLSSIGMVFLSSSIMFGLLAFYGYTTKQDLLSFGKMLLFGLIAVIIMSLINIFIGSSSFGIFLSIVSILIFLGLTAYDMKNLKDIYAYYSNDAAMLDKASIYGALNLYLDFVNILIKLLSLFGKRKD